jgi:ABC-type bacteriocin/lantibiotic exporter with double-glycine peptidase domain
VVDRAIPDSDTKLLTGAAYVLLAVVVSSALVAVVRGRQLLNLRVAGDAALTESFLRHLGALPLGYFLTRSAGDLMLRLRSIAIVRELLATATLSAVLDGVSATLYLVLLGLVSPLLALAAAVPALVELAVLIGTRRRVEHQQTEVLAHQVRTQVAGIQLFSGILMLKGLGAEGTAVERYRTTFGEELRAFARRTRTSTTVEALLGTVRLAVPVLVLLVAARQTMSGQFSLGTALAASALAAGFAEPFSAFSAALVSLQVLPGHLERIDDVFTVPLAARPEQEYVARQRIAVENVSFAYAKTARPSLSDISLTLDVGSFVVVSGSSGGGKTTLANVLAGLLEPTSGVVRYDDVVVSGFGATARAGTVGVVAQGSTLFDGSIRDNLTISDPDADDDVLYAHLDVAGIGDFVRTLPLGLDTIVGDGGTALSGGQGQRIAVARALAGRPSMLVLDEATNQLDAVSEARLLANVRATVPSVVLVTHRVALQDDADVVVSVEGGRLAGVTHPRRGPYPSA